jgi:hypothetical protein
MRVRSIRPRSFAYIGRIIDAEGRLWRRLIGPLGPWLRHLAERDCAVDEQLVSGEGEHAG